MIGIKKTTNMGQAPSDGSHPVSSSTSSSSTSTTSSTSRRIGVSRHGPKLGAALRSLVMEELDGVQHFPSDLISLIMGYLSNISYLFAVGTVPALYWNEAPHYRVANFWMLTTPFSRDLAPVPTHGSSSPLSSVSKISGTESHLMITPKTNIVDDNNDITNRSNGDSSSHHPSSPSPSSSSFTAPPSSTTHDVNDSSMWIPIQHGKVPSLYSSYVYHPGTHSVISCGGSGGLTDASWEHPLPNDLQSLTIPNSSSAADSVLSSSGWSPLPPLPRLRQQAILVLLNQASQTSTLCGGGPALMILGGSEYTHRVDYYDIRKAKWGKLAKLPSYHLGGACVVVDNTILVIGGEDSQARGSTPISRFNLNNLRWGVSILSSTPIPRRCHRMECYFDNLKTHKNWVIILGGTLITAMGQDGPLAHCEIYSPSNDTFYECPFSLPAPIDSFASCILHDRYLLIHGGNLNYGSPMRNDLHGSSWWYDLTTIDWSILKVATPGRVSHHNSMEINHHCLKNTDMSQWRKLPNFPFPCTHHTIFTVDEE